MAIRLLIVMLTIIPNHTGINAKMSDTSKNHHRYPPTIKPIGKAPTTQANKRRLRSKNTKPAAIKFAKGPIMISTGPKKYIILLKALLTTHPIVTPNTTGHPNNAAKAIKQSATRNCTGPETNGLPTENI